MDLRREGVVFVTEHSPQSTLFVQYIRDHIQCEVTLASPDDTVTSLASDWPLLILDADHLSEGQMQQWQEALAEQQLQAEKDDPGSCLAALNMRDEVHAAEVLTFMHLSGVFYRHDSLEMICKGIDRLLDGHLWMSRTLMTRLIEFFRKQSINSYRPACGLTQRELEIIGMLGSGASNMQIADRLFVSEHTVKSHLYNIFKKIDVHNRTQAVNWARQNLGAPPPLMNLHGRKGGNGCNRDPV